MLTLDQVMTWLIIINLWTKSHGVTIQRNPLWQNFWTVLQLNAGFANFIDEWSQCDSYFTNLGVILE